MMTGGTPMTQEIPKEETAIRNVMWVKQCHKPRLGTVNIPPTSLLFYDSPTLWFCSCSFESVLINKCVFFLGATRRALDVPTFTILKKSW